MRESKANCIQVVCLVVVAAIALVLTVGVPTARSDGKKLGGTFKGTAPFSYLSPCNNKTVSGTVNITATVNLFGDESHTQAYVSVIYDAPNQTDGTNKYNAYGRATATYDTLAAGGG